MEQALISKKLSYDKIIEILFLLLAIALPISGAMTSGLWILLFLLTLIKFVKKPDFSIFLAKIHWPLYLFILITILSIIYAANVHESIKELKKTSEIFIMFMFIYNMKDNLALNKKFIKYLFIAVSLSGILGLIQYTLGIEFTSPNNTISFLNPFNLNLNWVPSLPKYLIDFLAATDGKIHGTQAHHIFYGEIMSSVLAFVAPLIIYKILSKKIFWIKSIFINILFWIICLSIAFTFSRGAWLGTIASILFMFFNNKKFLKLLFINIFFIFFIVLMYNQVGSLYRLKSTYESIKTRINNIKINQNLDRIEMWQVGIKIIKANPFLGVGPKCVPFVYKKYCTPNNKIFQVGHVHNNYIQIGVDRGLLGLAFFIIMFFTYFGFLYINYKRLENFDVKYIAFGGACFIVAFLVYGITEYCFGTNVVAMLMWAILGSAISAVFNGNK